MNTTGRGPRRPGSRSAPGRGSTRPSWGAEPAAGRRHDSPGQGSRSVDELFDWIPADESVPASDGEKLQKVIARAGLVSRRAAETLIDEGRVRVNGEVAHLGRRVDASVDRIEVDGVLLSVEPGLVYFLLNKPAGVVTTAHDPQGRPTVVEFVPNQQRVFPVGRLDADTQGLLLLTNDGPLTQLLTHPSFGVEKEYLAKVAAPVSAGGLRRLRDGVELDDGITAPAKVSQPAPGLIRLTIHEGRNRQVRRMLDAIGHPVLELVRTRIGPITDASLRLGDWRELGPDEVRALAASATPTRRGYRRPAGPPPSAGRHQS
jgi:23S rRNA pseudouridine2605 synthase